MKRLAIPVFLTLGIALTTVLVGLCLIWVMQESPAQQLADAKGLMARGRFGEARNLLNQVIEQSETDHEAHYLLGLAAFRSGDLDVALDALQKVPNHSIFAGKASTTAAAIALENGDFVRGERALRVAIGQPGAHRTEALEMLVRVLRFQDRRWEAADFLKQEIAKGAPQLELLRSLWMLDAQAVPINRTQEMFENAARAHPEDHHVQLGLANLSLREGNLEDAAIRLSTCLRKQSNNVALWRGWLAWALEAERADEVLKAMDRITIPNLEPNELLELDAWFAKRDDDPARERRALEQLVARDPDNLEALERLAQLALTAEMFETASAYRSRKAALDQAKDRYWNLFQLQDHELLPKSREMAELAEVLGRWTEAQGWWMIFAQRTPDNPEASGTLNRLKAEAQERTEEGKQLATWFAESNAIGAHTTEGRVVDRSSITTLPLYSDQANIAGLQFQFDPGHSAAHHLPETMSGGVGLLDFDCDGWIDVYLPQGGVFPSELSDEGDSDRLFRNRGDGRFEDVTASAGFLESGGGYGHGVAVGDYNNDGFPDLFLTRFDAYELWQNQSDGTFVNVTEAAGLALEVEWPTSAAWADFDNDGDLDLYVCHYLRWDPEHPRLCFDDESKQPIYCKPLLLESVPDRLFRNNGGIFEDVTAEAGIVDPHGRGLGVVVADLNDDHLLDIYVANDMTANYLYLNRGDFKFEEAGERAGVASSVEGGYQAGMGVDCGDLDRDGLPDLVVTNFYGEGTTYYRNLGSEFFIDASSEIGLATSRYLLGFGVALLDSNNDGQLDLASTNGMVNDSRPLFPYAMPTQLLLGNDTGHLVDVTERAGPPWTTPRVGRGMAIGDLDNNGRLDLILVPQDGPLAYLQNQSTEGHFVTIQLVGETSNRDAIGARVSLIFNERELINWRFGGRSYQSSHDPRLHFGLGEYSGPVALEVQWPSGAKDQFENLNVDSGYIIREGTQEVRSLIGFD